MSARKSCPLAVRYLNRAATGPDMPRHKAEQRPRRGINTQHPMRQKAMAHALADLAQPAPVALGRAKVKLTRVSDGQDTQAFAGRRQPIKDESSRKDVCVPLRSSGGTIPKYRIPSPIVILPRPGRPDHFSLFLPVKIRTFLLSFIMTPVTRSDRKTRLRLLKSTTDFATH